MGRDFMWRIMTGTILGAQGVKHPKSGRNDLRFVVSAVYQPSIGSGFWEQRKRRSRIFSLGLSFACASLAVPIHFSFFTFAILPLPIHLLMLQTFCAHPTTVASKLEPFCKYTLLQRCKYTRHLMSANMGLFNRMMLSAHFLNMWRQILNWKGGAKTKIQNMVRKRGTENFYNLKESGNKFFLGTHCKKVTWTCWLRS